MPERSGLTTMKGTPVALVGDEVKVDESASDIVMEEDGGIRYSRLAEGIPEEPDCERALNAVGEPA